MYGYIYKTVNLETGRFYIGKKAYTHTIKKKLSKKRRKGTRKRIERVTVDSGWKEYYGSSEELKKDIELLGKENFEVIHLKECPNKQSLAYWEQYYMFTMNVLFENTYNGNIAGKFYRGKIIQ